MLFLIIAGFLPFNGAKLLRFICAGINGEFSFYTSPFGYGNFGSL